MQWDFFSNKRGFGAFRRGRDDEDMDDFAESARLVFDETIDFAEYEKRTGRRWKWWANKMKAGWKPESWMGEDDIRQELLIAVWLAFFRFTPGRNTEPARFVEYTATRKVQKAVSRAGGYEQHRRFKRTRQVVPMEEAPEPHTPPEQEFKVDLGRLLGVLMSKCKTRREAVAMRALKAELSLEGAAQAIMQDTRAALVCRVASEEEALEVVRDSLGKVVKRVEKEMYL